MKRSLHQRAERMLAPLAAERDALAGRIEHGWGWLDRHPDDARFAAKEDQLLGWLIQYETLERAISRAQEALK